MHRQLHRRKLLPAIGKVSPRNASGEFGPQGNRIAAAVFETIHFLGNNIGRLTQAARKHRSGFNHRQLQALKTIKLAHAFEGRDHMRKAFLGLTEHVLRAAHGLGCLYLCHNEAP